MTFMLEHRKSQRFSVPIFFFLIKIETKASVAYHFNVIIDGCQAYLFLLIL